MISAQDIMSEHVVTVEPDMHVGQAAHLMLRDRVSGFPVVDPAGIIVGIVTMTDLFSLIQGSTRGQSVEDFYKKLPAFSEMPVRDVMSTDVITIAPQTKLIEILDIVVHKNVHAFPVLEAGKIIGIVSRHDILNAIYVFGREDAGR